MPNTLLRSGSAHPGWLFIWLSLGSFQGCSTPSREKPPSPPPSALRDRAVPVAATQPQSPEPGSLFPLCPPPPVPCSYSFPRTALYPWRSITLHKHVQFGITWVKNSVNIKENCPHFGKENFLDVLNNFTVESKVFHRHNTGGFDTYLCL